MALLHINLLGGIEVTMAGEPLLISSRKAATLLGYLALSRPHGIPRGKLSALLWDGRFGERARASLRQVLLTLRHVLPQYAAVIAADRDGVRIYPDMIETDVDEFEQVLRTIDPARLRRAAALYRGELFDGIGPTSYAFEAWLAAERQRLKSHAILAMETLMNEDGDRRESIESVIALALRILAVDPLQEQVHRTLMRCYAQQGRRTEALRQYNFCRSVLWKEVRASPEDETERLQRDIRRVTSDLRS